MASIGKRLTEISIHVFWFRWFGIWSRRVKKGEGWEGGTESTYSVPGEEEWRFATTGTWCALAWA